MLMNKSRPGEYGQDLFTLRSMYLQGRPPPSVSMYWRRFAVADMPLDDHDKFELWLRDRWYEKDAFMEQYLTTGEFPASKAAINDVKSSPEHKDFIETEVKLAHWWEIGNIFLVLATFGLLANILARVWNVVWYGKQV
jgi:lysocardiolipin and lysophospholipid acyltransferase